jgi:hypothetical protein
VVIACAVLLAAPAWACAPDRTEPVTGLTAQGPLLAGASDGRRIRLAMLVGEAPVPADQITRIAPLGPPDRHERVPVLALGADGPVEAEILRQGLARLSLGHRIPRDCWVLLERAEGEAIAAQRGIWATPRSLLDTNDDAALSASEGRFIVASGRVRSVRTVNRITYVNFGPPGAGALTVTIRDADMEAFRAAGLEPAAFRGHMLRVRGVVTIRRGPFIAAAVPEALTIAEAPGGGAR